VRKNGRRTSIHSEHEMGITEQSIYRKSHKEYRNLPSIIKRFTLRKSIGMVCNRGRTEVVIFGGG